MRATVLINNHNYGRYLEEAVASVLAQTKPPHEIIVVDDGSSDDSRSVLTRLSGREPGLRVHFQPNRGQLAAFRAGLERAEGDYCAFLDADDLWEPSHLEEAMAVLDGQPEVGMYYCGHRESEGPERFRSLWPEGTVGPIPALTAAGGARAGTITSTLLLRRDVARRALDFPAALDEDWRIRADDCLIYGAAFAGALIHHRGSATVRYRIHGENGFAASARTADEEYRHRNRVARLFRALSERHGVYQDRMVNLLREEAALPRNRTQPFLRRKYRRALRRVVRGVPGRIGLKLRLAFLPWCAA